MKHDLTQEQIVALLDAIRETEHERPPNTFRTEELCEALACGPEKARIILKRLLSTGKAQPVQIRHRDIRGSERWVTAWQIVVP